MDLLFNIDLDFKDNKMDLHGNGGVIIFNSRIFDEELGGIEGLVKSIKFKLEAVKNLTDNNSRIDDELVILTDIDKISNTMNNNLNITPYTELKLPKIKNNDFILHFMGASNILLKLFKGQTKGAISIANKKLNKKTKKTYL